MVFLKELFLNKNAGDKKACKINKAQTQSFVEFLFIMIRKRNGQLNLGNRLADDILTFF